MPVTSVEFLSELACSPEDIRAAAALRYEVFVEEMGASGPWVDHENRLESDPWDAHCDHLLLRDPTSKKVIGVYRLITQDAAKKAGGFYSASEYDLSPLIASGRKILELGRSCVHPDYRGGLAMFYLWGALAEYIQANDIEVLFGVASFHGTDPKALAQPLSMLHHNHLAPAQLRPKAHSDFATRMDLIDASDLDRKAAMLAVPQLIKAYLRLGGGVGEGAYIDHAFNTTDVCLVLDVAKMSPTQRKIYTPKARTP